MPITPRFRLSQTSLQVQIIIHVPHVRVSASTVEISVVDQEVHFYSSPYLLHVTLPDAVHGDDAENAAHAPKATLDPDCENGTLTIFLNKKTEGMWDDLEWMGNLIVPTAGDKRRRRRRGIEVLKSTEFSKNETEEKEKEDEEAGDDDDDEFVYEESNNDAKDNAEVADSDENGFGFLKQFPSTILTDSSGIREGLLPEILELPQMLRTPESERRTLRFQTEQEKFNVDRYVEDLDVQDDYIYSMAMTMKPHYHHSLPSAKKSNRNNLEDQETENSSEDLTSQMNKKLSLSDNHDTEQGSGETSKASTPTSCFFTSEELLQLSSIRPKLDMPRLTTATLLSDREMDAFFLSLVDILWAYCYDHRTTGGEPTVESSWTIATLSATFSWLESPPVELQEVVISSLRRCLIYPYLRHYPLCHDTIGSDVVLLLSAGPLVVVRCLLQIRSILERSEVYYLLNQWYLDPYIAWITSCSKRNTQEMWRDWSQKLRTALSTTTKAGLGLRLEEIEEVCKSGVNECDEDDEGSDENSENSESDSGSDFDSDSGSSSNEESGEQGTENDDLTTSRPDIKEDVAQQKDQPRKPKWLLEEIG